MAEREWIAGHVHDETLQTLAVARQDIEEALDGDRTALTSAGGHLDDAVEELRRTLVHVHPGSVAGQGLGPALEAYADQVLRRGGTDWTVEVEPGAGRSTRCCCTRWRASCSATSPSTPARATCR